MKLLRIVAAGVISISICGKPLAADPASELPVPVGGWSIQVIVSAPKISHPSVVTCAPDGRVFVAEDPMDISAAAAHLPLGRILCLHPDGKLTLFAEDLHAVFGMQYLDGRLYVLHNPKFSIFEDGGGVGRNRVDVIESTHPEPWALDWNDHVPANFRLAMDGYFYVAVGDKGLYRCVGTDGREVNLHGGGIVRLRPDGSGLEIYCRGIRNILDVAITSDDELFTYDNTDEQQWMSRVTHMVDGGFYGYPYDFIPRRPYTLWTMADYGGGAATGVFAYTEDSLPAVYHDNLFLADFGKRQILRLELERSGATFRVAKRTDLFTEVPDEFRPVGIALDQEGTSIYICDWQHRDTKEKVQVGRLLKLSWQGRSNPAPRPSWYVTAAMGGAVDASNEELVAALAHPSRRVRQTAQRRISQRGECVAAVLARVLDDTHAPLHARWHALWALDAIDAGKLGRAAIVRAARGPDAPVARQALRQLGMRQVEGCLDIVLGRLKDTDASIRFAAATAAGRIGSAAAVPALLRALDQRDLFVRFAVFTALNRIGRSSPGAWRAIAAGLESQNRQIREGTALALQETYDARLASELIAISRRSDARPAARIEAIRLLADLHRKRPEWQGEWWAYHPVNSAQPGKTVSWEATEDVMQCFRESLIDPQREIRAAAIATVVATRDPLAAAQLRHLASNERDDHLRQQAVRTLGVLEDEASSTVVASILSEAEASKELVLAAIEAAPRMRAAVTAPAVARRISDTSDRQVVLTGIVALGRIARSASVPVLGGFLRHEDAEIRIAAVDALAVIPDARVDSMLLEKLRDPSIEARRKILEAVGRRKIRESVPELVHAYNEDEVRREATMALLQMPDVRAVSIYLDLLGQKNTLLRDKAATALGQIRDQALPLVERQIADLNERVVLQLQQVYAGHKLARAGPLFRRNIHVPAPAEYRVYALEHPGDPLLGKQLFADEAGLACSKCHANAHVHAQLTRIGPDLSTAGKQFSREAIIESILEPNKSVREGYQQTLIVKENGQVLAGIVASETETELVIVDADTQTHRVAKQEIEQRKLSNLSLMPEDQYLALSPQEFADLVAFLADCKE